MDDRPTSDTGNLWYAERRAASRATEQRTSERLINKVRHNGRGRGAAAELKSVAPWSQWSGCGSALRSV